MIPKERTDKDETWALHKDTDSRVLLQRVKTGALSPQSHKIALQELASRGENIASLPKSPEEGERDQPQLGLFAACWTGQESPWKAFWILALFASLCRFVLQWTPMPTVMRKPTLATVGVFFAVFISVSVWRCANNTNSKFWKMTARLLVIIAFVAPIAVAILTAIAR